MSERPLLDILRDIYRVPLATDVFGRRDAMPSEIVKVIRGERGVIFTKDVDLFLPTELDIGDKGDGER